MPHLPQELLGIVASFTPRAVFLARAGRAWWRAAGEHFWRAVIAATHAGAHRGSIWVTPARLVARFPRLGALAPYEAPGLPRFEELPDTFAERLRVRWRAWNLGVLAGVLAMYRAGEHVVEVFANPEPRYRVDGGDPIYNADGAVLVACSPKYAAVVRRSQALLVHDRATRETRNPFEQGHIHTRPGLVHMVGDAALVAYDTSYCTLHLLHLDGSRPNDSAYVGSSDVSHVVLCGTTVAIAAGNRLSLVDLSDIRTHRTLPVPRVTRLAAVGDALVLNGSLRINTS